jgi:hypothetical protein
MRLSSPTQMTAALVLAAFVSACQTSVPPTPSAEGRLLAAGYVKQGNYPQPFSAGGTYDARFVCGPPACPVRGSVSYFTTRLSGGSDGRQGQERVNATSSADLRRNLQAAADNRGSGRRYTGVQRVSVPGAAGYESTSVSPQEGGLSYTRSRATIRGDAMRITVSNGQTPAQAARGLRLGVED